MYSVRFHEVLKYLPMRNRQQKNQTIENRNYYFFLIKKEENRKIEKREV